MSKRMGKRRIRVEDKVHCLIRWKCARTRRCTEGERMLYHAPTGTEHSCELRTGRADR